jgi:hypothetical protein
MNPCSIFLFAAGFVSALLVIDVADWRKAKHYRERPMRPLRLTRN